MSETQERFLYQTRKLYKLFHQRERFGVFLQEREVRRNVNFSLYSIWTYGELFRWLYICWMTVFIGVGIIYEPLIGLHDNLRVFVFMFVWLTYFIPINDSFPYWKKRVATVCINNLVFLPHAKFLKGCIYYRYYI